nr:BLUF domain-containing protein [Alteromonas sp. Cnat3-28]
MVKIDENELLKITNDSLPFNAKNHITGILLFDGEYFFQVLEGDCEKVTGFSNI